MKYSIRHYKHDDYQEISKWWSVYDKQINKEFLSEETTFILEIDEKPALSITVYLTNCYGICFLENFIGNPEFKGSDRKEASKILVNFAYDFAKECGFKNIIGFSTADKLEEYYKKLGMNPLVKNMTSMIRGL